MDTIMKKIFKLFAIALSVATVAVSCDLSEYNPNAPGFEMVFGNATNIQYSLNQFYDAFPTVTGAYSKEPGGVDYFTANTLSERYTQGYTSSLPQSWGSWDRIYKINYFLNQMESSACGVTGAVKDDFVGQGRLFRAYTYFGMLKQYGDLPWYDHVITPSDTDYEYKERDSRDLIVKNILEDLDYAIEHITATSPDATCVTKAVAQFIKMHVCLYEASFRKYNNVTASVTGVPFSHYTPESLYRLCAQTAEALMGQGYELIANYRDLFLSEKLQTKEVILGAQTGDNIRGSQNNYVVYAKQSNPRSFCRTFINTYLMADGTPYTTQKASVYATEGWATEFDGRDPRLKLTVWHPGYKFNGAAAIPEFTCAPLGYEVRKFCYDKPADTSTATPDEKDKSNLNSTPVFRYAEVLLDYAEAKAELGEMTADVWAKTIGAIRKRAGITGSSLTSVPTTVDNYLKTNFYPNVNDAVILEIRRERAVELSLEGRRNEDLIRWGCGNCLATVPWDGINIDAVDTPIDLDGDGVKETCFFTKGSAGSEAGIHYVEATGKTGLTAVKNGSKYQLKYDIGSNLRYWASDNHLILDCLPHLVITDYRDKGYSLTQNPGY